MGCAFTYVCMETTCTNAESTTAVICNICIVETRNLLGIMGFHTIEIIAKIRNSIYRVYVVDTLYNIDTSNLYWLLFSFWRWRDCHRWGDQDGNNLGMHRKPLTQCPSNNPLVCIGMKAQWPPRQRFSKIQCTFVCMCTIVCTMFKEVSNLDMHTHHQGINSHYIDQIEKLYSVSDTTCKIIFIFDRHWF